jgi:hypothetical protein
MATEATTQEEIEDLLHAEHMKADFGAELLDENHVLKEDISDDLQGGYVDRNNYSTVHGKCQLKLSRPLTWGTDRVRPYVTCTGAGYWKRWNLGVYRVTAPDTKLGESPLTYDASGEDPLALLARPIGDGYYVASGAKYLEAIEQVISDSEAGGPPPLLDGTAEASTLSAPMVWLLEQSNIASWLGIVNDLAAAIGYRGLWANRDGRYCSEPYQSPTVRTPTWMFDVTDEQRQMVVEDRTLSVDEGDETNYFVFVQVGTEDEPTSGDGLYIVDNSAGGTKYKRTWWLNTEGQAELEAEGDRIVEEMSQRKRTIKFPSSPAPVLWHFDVVDYHDLPAGGYLKGQVMNWKLPLDPEADMEVQMEVVS